MGDSIQLGVRNLGCVWDLLWAGFRLSLSEAHCFLTVKSGENVRPPWRISLVVRKERREIIEGGVVEGFCGEDKRELGC